LVFQTINIRVFAHYIGHTRSELAFGSLAIKSLKYTVADKEKFPSSGELRPSERKAYWEWKQRKTTQGLSHIFPSSNLE